MTLKNIKTMSSCLKTINNKVPSESSPTKTASIQSRKCVSTNPISRTVNKRNSSILVANITPSFSSKVNNSNRNSVCSKITMISISLIVPHSQYPTRISILTRKHKTNLSSKVSLVVPESTKTSPIKKTIQLSLTFLT